jgi:transposase
MVKKPVFKTYQPTQAFLFPPSLEELIDANHPVRTVAEVIDQINIDELMKRYKGGGASSYHPRMLLKVLVYAYIKNIYSSRKIEASCKENIHFMWLAGMNKPDHHTINRFRTERLRLVVKEVFAQVVLLLSDAGHLTIREVFTDGTKMEANANRYTFVWGKAIKNNRERIKEQIKELWSYSQRVASEELNDDTPPDFDKINSTQVKETIERINEALKDKPVSKEVKSKLNYAKRNWAEKLDQYEEQEQILAGRNSYSKTDKDATFMRMKDDHLGTGQLKPAYNLQISTNNQFIVNYSIHPNANDTNTLPEHIDQHKALYNDTPDVVVADAGYGSEQNYSYLEENGIEAYVKHNFFDKDQKAVANKNRKDTSEGKKPFTVDKLYYNESKDHFICPMGQVMNNVGEVVELTQAGYKRTITKYQAQNCEGCPLRVGCYKAKGNRIVEVSHEGQRLKQKVVARLLSDQGIAYRKRRCHDVETVFANLKHNKGYRRFMLRGKEKVLIEMGLLAIAHNLKKKTA